MTSTGSQTRADVVIIGSGLIGALVAHEVRRLAGELTVLVVEAGPDLGRASARHLSTVSRLAGRVHTQQAGPNGGGAFRGTCRRTELRSFNERSSIGLYPASGFGWSDRGFGGAALSWNVGGMGVYWRGMTPRPTADEIPGELCGAAWDAAISRAEEALSVRNGYAVDADIAEVRDHLARRLGGLLSLRPMPRALAPGRCEPVGPADIFPPLRDAAEPGVVVLKGHLATRLNVVRDSVASVRAVRLADGEPVDIAAEAVVVCADALRTPQLLWASGIRPAALGRYLNEHAVVSAYLRLDPSLYPVARPPVSVSTDHVVDLVPYGAAHGFHGQIAHFVQRGGAGDIVSYGLGFLAMVPTELDASSQVEFSTTEYDRLGLPRGTMRYARSAKDTQRIEHVQRDVEDLARGLVCPGARVEMVVMDPGASLHYTGTVRLGTNSDDSVCSADSRVWGFRNLFVGGNGVIPSALACNSTLTAAALAVHSMPSVVRSVAGTDPAVSYDLGQPVDHGRWGLPE